MLNILRHSSLPADLKISQLQCTSFRRGGNQKHRKVQCTTNSQSAAFFKYWKCTLVESRESKAELCHINHSFLQKYYTFLVSLTMFPLQHLYFPCLPYNVCEPHFCAPLYTPMHKNDTPCVKRHLSYIKVSYPPPSPLPTIIRHCIQLNMN